MRSAMVYEYDPQLRPGTLGVDFQSDNPNEEYTLRFEPDEATKLGRSIVDWLTGK